LWYTFFPKIHFRLFRAGSMPVSMDFFFSHHYSFSAEGIEVPVTHGNGGQSVELIVKLDTGAAHGIFERRYAEILGINPESAGFNPSGQRLAPLQHTSILSFSKY
jgi:hypothetical protein